MKRNLNLLLLTLIATLLMGVWCTHAHAEEQETTTSAQVETTAAPETLNGFVTEGGKKYYYKNGVKVKGWLTLKGSKYHFGSDGVMNTGYKKIGKYYYNFAKNGIMRKGLIKIKKKLYFFNSKGHGIGKGFIKCFDKKTRYGLGGGKVAVGSKKIKGKCYFFNIATGTKHKKGLFTYKNRKYFCKGNGVLKTGYKAFKSKKTKKYYGIYFSKKSGRQVKGRKIGHLKIPKSGVLSEAYAYGIKKLNKHGWSLRKAFSYSTGLAYYGQLFRTSSSEKYALRGFKHGHGNCYVMAATFFIQAKLLGYNAHHIAGYVGSAPHSWVTIRHKYGKSVYDPDFQHETGRWGYRIYYGKPGTWRYNSAHVIG